MTRRAELRGVSSQEYLVWERGQVGRHEFFNGEVFAMAGGSLRLRIEHFRRGRDGTWIYRLAGPGGFIELSSGARLEVDSIFVGVMSLPGD